MITFKKYLTEVWNKRVDIPYDNKTNAPTRYNNPGGAYPSQKFEKLGLRGYGVIGGGHKIGYYNSVQDGVAANIYHLRSMPVVGKTVAEMRHYWVNGNFNGRKSLPGMNDNQVITNELLQDHNWLASWMVATAKAEGFQGTLDKNVFDAAFKKLDNVSSYDPSKTPEMTGNANKTTPPSPETNTYSNTDTTYNTVSDALGGLQQGAKLFTLGMGGGIK